MKDKKITSIKFIILLLTIFFISILNADTKVNLNLKWKHQFQFAGFYIALENGYYKKYGIDVDINEFSATTLNDVINNKIQFGVSDSSILQKAIIGESVVALMAVLQESPRVLVSLKSKNINTLLNLQNKIIEVPKLSSSSAEIYGMLRSYNINFQTKKSTFGIDDLIDGKTDVISAYISNEPYLLEKRGFKTNIIKPSDFGFNHFGDMLYTSKKYLKDNPKIVENFVKASIEGWLYAFNNIEETANLILEKYNSQNKSYDALIYEANELKKLAGDLNRFGEISNIKAKQIILGHSILFPNKKNDLVKAQNSIYEKNLELTVLHEKKVFLTNEEKEYLKQNPEINVGFALNFPPLLIKNNNNQYEGIAVDLYEIISKKLGIKINYIIDDWEVILNKVKNGEIDVVPLMNKNTAEKFSLKTSDELYDLRVMVFKKINNSYKINTIEDLQGLKVAYNKRILVLDKYLSKFKDKIELIPLEDEDEIFSLLNDDKVDAVIAFNISNYTVIKRILNSIKPIHTLDEPIIGSVSGINPNNPILESIIKKAISSITPNDKKAVSNKWLGDFSQIESEVLFTKKEKEIIRKNSFTVCEQHNIYPLSGVKDGKMLGIRGEYFDEIIRKSQLNLKFIETKNLDDLKKKVKENKCDIVGSVGSNQKVFPNIVNSDVIMQFPFGIMGDISSLNISPFSDLSDRTFIVRFKNIADKIKEFYPDTKILIINDIDEAIKKIGGKVHFIALKPVIEKVIQDYGYKKYKLNGILHRVSQDSSIGVIESNTLLLNILNKVIATISSDFNNNLLNKYSIKEFKVIESSNKWYILLAIVLSVLVLHYLRLDYLNRIKQKELLESLVDKNDEISKINKSLQNILNQQNNIVIIKNKDELEYANKKFYDFFAFKDLEDYKSKFKSIEELFVKNEKYFHPSKLDKKQNWVNVLKSLPDNERIVLFMSKDNNLHAFSVSLNNLDKYKYVISFTDISQTIITQIDLEEKTIRDKLTNTYNREFFDKNYQTFINKFSIKGNNLAIVMLDIDKFKLVNDNFGHDVGDKVLIHFVKTIKNFSRKDDILIRWGGEEFILILPVDSVHTLSRVLEHLRKVVEIEPMPEIKRITASFGGTLYIKDEDILDTIKRADKAVYEAKETGRNRVVIH